MGQCEDPPPSTEQEGKPEKGEDDVIDRTNDAFSFAVLRRGVGTGHAKNGASSEEERAHGEVIEFPPIITLNGFHGAAKLGRNVGKKGNDSGYSVRFQTKQKHP